MIESNVVEQKRGRGRPKTGRDPMFGYRAPRQLMAKARIVAAQRGVTVSDVIREKLNDFVGNYGQESAA
jgi:hypothetical protein